MFACHEPNERIFDQLILESQGLAVVQSSRIGPGRGSGKVSKISVLLEALGTQKKRVAGKERVRTVWRTMARDWGEGKNLPDRLLPNLEEVDELRG